MIALIVIPIPSRSVGSSDIHFSKWLIIFTLAPMLLREYKRAILKHGYWFHNSRVLSLYGRFVYLQHMADGDPGDDLEPLQFFEERFRIQGYLRRVDARLDAPFR